MDEDQLVSETIDVLQNFKSSILPCIQSAKNLLSKVKDGQLDTKDGISLYDLKNKLFLSYLIDLTSVCSAKLSGSSLAKNEAIERIVEERCVLEKIRPIEHKLKYQVDKLMKVLSDAVVDESDPLNYKPNLSNLVADEREEDEDEQKETSGKQENEVKKSKSGIYVPPRLAQMKFEDEEEKKNRAFERAKKRAISSSIMKDLMREYDDAPEEEHDSMLHQKSRIGKYLKERKRFEEDNFIRINLTKKQKAEARKLTTINTIGDDITRFEDVSVLDMKNSSDFVPQKKRKTGGKNKNKSKKFKSKKRR